KLIQVGVHSPSASKENQNFGWSRSPSATQRASSRPKGPPLVLLDSTTAVKCHCDPPDAAYLARSRSCAVNNTRTHARSSTLFSRSCIILVAFHRLAPRPESRSHDSV